MNEANTKAEHIGPAPEIHLPGPVPNSPTLAQNAPHIDLRGLLAI